MSDLKIGDTVRVSNSATLAGTVGQIVPAGPHQFEDEVTVDAGGKLLYFRCCNLELVHDIGPEQPVEYISQEQADALIASGAGAWLDAPVLERHPNSARFHELLAAAGEMHDAKQLDYGKGDDPFANVRASADWNMPAWVGAMVRLTDKVKRLQSLRQKGYVANESAKDSFMDIAVYALIAYVLYEQDEASA